MISQLTVMLRTIADDVISSGMAMFENKIYDQNKFENKFFEVKSSIQLYSLHKIPCLGSTEQMQGNNELNTNFKNCNTFHTVIS